MIAARFLAWLACVLLIGPASLFAGAKDKTPKDKFVNDKYGAKDKKDKAKDPLKAPFTIRCAREDAIYKVGEKATFLIYSDSDETGKFRFSEDGYKTIKEGAITVKAGEVYNL